MTFVQDNKDSSTMTEDTRTSPSSLTQDDKSIGNSLWSSLMATWQLDFPWQWKGNGQIITLDLRSNDG
jgi:hypothetical protein